MTGIPPSHTFNLDHKWYEFIVDGIKIYEGRILDEKRKLININDHIKIVDNKTKHSTLLWG